MSDIDTKMQQNPYLITLDSGANSLSDILSTDPDSLINKFVKREDEPQIYKVLYVDQHWVMLGWQPQNEFLPPAAFMSRKSVKRATFKQHYDLCQSCI